MTSTPTLPADRSTARLTGLAYFGIITTGVFAEFVVRSSLFTPGDAAATAADIAGSAGLFRAGIAADLLMIALDVGVAVGLYVLLRPVHRTLALLAAALRLIQAAVLGANLVNLADALQFATRGEALQGIDASTLDALTLGAMETHALTYDLGLVFFGLACLVLGRLLSRSDLVPTAVATGVFVAGVVYLVGSFMAVLAPSASTSLDPVYVLPFLAEIAFAGWLAIKAAAMPASEPIRHTATAT